MPIRRIVPITLGLVLISTSSGALELEFRNEANRHLQKRINGAVPGDSVSVPPGTYIGSLRLPEGVSVSGRSADECKILGDVLVEKSTRHEGHTSANRHASRVEGLTLFHLGGRSNSLLQLNSVRAEVRNCVIASNGGFAAISANSGARVTIQNSIIVGPLGDYGVFSRGNGRLEILNCTLVCRGFGVGLMDGSKAVIRDCLFTGSHKVAVIRTHAEYAISHCNLSLGGGSFYHNHEFIDGSIRLRDPHNHPQNSTPGDVSNRDHAGYDNKGLSFLTHRPPAELSVAAFRDNEPGFAAGAGSPLPNGEPRGLGAFRGESPGWTGRPDNTTEQRKQ